MDKVEESDEIEEEIPEHEHSMTYK